MIDSIDLYLKFKCIVFLVLISTLSCSTSPDNYSRAPASSPNSSSGNEYRSKAHPASYGSDGFMIYTPPPYHEPKRTPSSFFPMDCDLGGPSSHISKTSYLCETMF